MMGYHNRIRLQSVNYWYTMDQSLRKLFAIQHFLESTLDIMHFCQLNNTYVSVECMHLAQFPQDIYSALHILQY